MHEFTVIGPAILDVMAGPVGQIQTGRSNPMEYIRLSLGGDALNEAMALASLKADVQLVSKLGKDAAGQFILQQIKERNVDSSLIAFGNDPTGINIALVDQTGERSFLTEAENAMRTFNLEEIEPYLADFGRIVSFASLFISRKLSLADMESLFISIRKSGRILAADTTIPKQKETFEQIAPLLKHLNFFFPNESELQAISGCEDLLEGVNKCLEAGVGCLAVKLGSKGCLLAYEDQRIRIPAFAVQAVDSTGAGDCFAAGFLFAFSKGLSLKECACFGCILASFNVQAVGSTQGLPDPEVVWERFHLYMQNV